MSSSGVALGRIFLVIDLTGVLANAALGGVLARTELLDPIGFGALAILSGLGGGLIRDTLLQHGPPVALTHDAYLVAAVAGAAIVFFVPVRGRFWDAWFPYVDAVALGCWAASGAQRTLATGLGWLPAVLLGATTAVGGGAVRDIVLRRVPAIFAGNTLYATSAVIGSAVMVGVSRAGHPAVGLVASAATGAGVSMLARWRGWQLPVPAWHSADGHVPSPSGHWVRGRRRKERRPGVPAGTVSRGSATSSLGPEGAQPTPPAPTPARRDPT